VNPALILVIALSGAAWQCDNREGLWECRPPPATAAGEAAPTVSADGEGGAGTPVPEAAATNPTQPIPRAADAGAGYGAPVNEGAPGAEDAEDTEAAAAANTGASTAASADAWVVQIAAYRDKEAAQAAARDISYAGLIIMPIRREGENWFVLLLGA